MSARNLSPRVCFFLPAYAASAKLPCRCIDPPLPEPGRFYPIHHPKRDYFSISLIGSTWRFVRRDGGPDRRFNNNRQLPILRYQAMLMLGPGNFAKVIYLSKSSDRAKLLATISGLALLHGSRVISGGQEPDFDRRLALQ